jgi:hypothetical protein
MSGSTTVQLAGNGFGGLIQGNFGNYQQATDGTFTVDTRDAPPLLARGMAYVRQQAQSHTTPLAPGVATIGAIIASGALSNGTVAITANPDVPRPVDIEVGTGTGAITAGTVAITYVGNDGASGTDTLSAVCGASTSTTQTLSRGVVTITSVTVAGLVGGTSPWIRASTKAQVSVPVAAGAVDVAFIREYDTGATVAVGTAGTALASIAPTNAPNATRTYSFVYDYTAPVS